MSLKVNKRDRISLKGFAVGRAIRDAAREFFDPPELDQGRGVGKHV